MRNTTILVVVSLLSLVAVILPSILFLAGRMSLTGAKWTMLVATVVWFVSASPWMWKKTGEQSQDETAKA